MAAPSGNIELIEFIVKAIVDEPEVVKVSESDGGRLLGWIGDTISEDDAKIGLDVQVVPRIFEDIEPIKVFYTVEQAGTTWAKAPA